MYSQGCLFQKWTKNNLVLLCEQWPKDQKFIVIYFVLQENISHRHIFYIVIVHLLDSSLGFILLVVTNIDGALLNGQIVLSGWNFPCPRFPFASNSGHYLPTQKEKGQTRCCIQSHSCGQGKGELRENACWICNGKSMNKEVEPSFSFLASQQQWPFFSFLFFLWCIY